VPAETHQQQSQPTSAKILLANRLKYLSQVRFLQAIKFNQQQDPPSEKICHIGGAQFGSYEDMIAVVVVFLEVEYLFPWYWM